MSVLSIGPLFGRPFKQKSPRAAIALRAICPA
jgi:hypothetical protein